MNESTFTVRIYDRESGKFICRRHLYRIGSGIYVYRVWRGFVEFNAKKYFFECA